MEPGWFLFLKKFVAMHADTNVKCGSTVESFTGKLVKHTRKPYQARNEMAKGKSLQKIQWNKIAKAEKGNIIPVLTTRSGITPHIVNLSTTWRRMVKCTHWLMYP